MSKLSEFLKNCITDAGLEQKGVAARFHEEHTRLVGAENALEWKTIQPKFTKLLKGDVEGEKFFLRDPKRRAALATVMAISEATLLALMEVRTLVLDPRLPKDARD